jgi:hypothetical protein
MNVLLCRRQQNKYNIWYIIIYNSIKSSNKPSDINIIHKEGIRMLNADVLTFIMSLCLEINDLYV